MDKPLVVYTDPAWAVGQDGRTDRSRASIEARHFGGLVDLRLAEAEGGRFPLDGSSLEALVEGADAIAIYRATVTSGLLDRAGPNLKVVARQGVGFDNLRPDLLSERGIIGFNIPDYCVDEVAAHTTALTLALERHMIPQHNALSHGHFNIYHGGFPRRLRSRTAGIVGFGRIGRVVASRLSHFYHAVQAFDPYVEGDLMVAHGVGKVDLPTLLATSDVVLLHCLLSDETREMMDAEAFARMKRSAILVNAARGALVNSRALAEALLAGEIAGAALDVFSPEDPNEDPHYRKLLELSNVVLTSHRAFLSAEAEASQRRRVSSGILRVLQTGEPPAVGHLTENTNRWPGKESDFVS